MDPTSDEGRFSRLRRSSMDRIVGDREIMLRQAEARAEAADARTSELESEMEALRAEAERRGREIEELRERLGSAPAEAGRGDASVQVSGEVRRILEAAEQTAAEMLEQARAEASRRRREADELWGDVQSEVARMAEWRAVVAPRMEGLRARLEQLGGLIDEVPDRLEEALRPLADAVRDGAAEVAAADADTHPPLLVAPGPEEGSGRDEPEQRRSSLDRGGETDLGGLSS